MPSTELWKLPRPNVCHEMLRAWGPSGLAVRPQYKTTPRIDSPRFINSKPSLICSSGSVWVISSSILILPSMYQSTIFGTSVRPRAPPKAEPRHSRPVTSWNGRVLISAPAGATPIITLSPQPLWADSKAVRITSTLPVASTPLPIATPLLVPTLKVELENIKVKQNSDDYRVKEDDSLQGVLFDYIKTVPEDLVHYNVEDVYGHKTIYVYFANPTDKENFYQIKGVIIVMFF